MHYQGIFASFPARDVGAAGGASSEDRADCGLTPTTAGGFLRGVVFTSETAHAIATAAFGVK